MNDHHGMTLLPQTMLAGVMVVTRPDVGTTPDRTGVEIAPTWNIITQVVEIIAGLYNPVYAVCGLMSHVDWRYELAWEGKGCATG